MLFLGFASNGETKRISTTAAASRILRSAERARRGRPCVDIAYPAALLEDSLEEESLPPDRFDDETLAFLVSEIFEDILSMYSCVMLAIFDVYLLIDQRSTG